jgi:hypothetical protein
MQRSVGHGERGAIEGQVRAEVKGAREVRVGSFHCSSCGKWIDVVSDPERWKGEQCAACG